MGHGSLVLLGLSFGPIERTFSPGQLLAAAEISLAVPQSLAIGLSRHCGGRRRNSHADNTPTPLFCPAFSAARGHPMFGFGYLASLLWHW
jgi:hypothetical protein